VTGHSLGAALATHAVADLIANNITVQSFYNFGSPRVGDARFV
jgi:predicted lipase